MQLLITSASENAETLKLFMQLQITSASENAETLKGTASTKKKTFD